MLIHSKYFVFLLLISVVVFSCSKKNDRLKIDLLPTYYATPTTIEAGGYIVEWGNKDITSRGICYALNDSLILDEDYTYVESLSASDERLFNCTLDNLISDTTYYICAFAKTSKGITYKSVGYTVYTNYTIGSTGPGGGMVFSTDGNGGGMEVIELSAYPDVQWGCTGVVTGASNTSFGYGSANTGLIVTNCGAPNSAAVVCDELVLNGFDDWYLPSLDELSYIHLTLYQKNNLLGLSANDFFWSSTEQNSTNAWAILFSDGSQEDIVKSSAAGILAVRAF